MCACVHTHTFCNITRITGGELYVLPPDTSHHVIAIPLTRGSFSFRYMPVKKMKNNTKIIWVGTYIYII